MLAVLAGVALISGTVVNKRQSKQLLTLETTLKAQRQKTAETELTLEQVRSAQQPRRISTKSFIEALKGKKAASNVILLYVPNDGEAYSFAQNIWWELMEAGWNPSHPAPIPSLEDTPYSTLLNAFHLRRGCRRGRYDLIQGRVEAYDRRKAVRSSTTALNGAIWLPASQAQPAARRYPDSCRRQRV